MIDCTKKFTFYIVAILGINSFNKNFTNSDNEILHSIIYPINDTIWNSTGTGI